MGRLPATNRRSRLYTYRICFPLDLIMDDDDMTGVEAIESVTNLAEISITFISLWLSITFGYLTVAYFLGGALSRFQCLTASVLYGSLAILFTTAVWIYTEATVLVIVGERSVFSKLPTGLFDIPWAHGSAVLCVGGTLLSFYFMYNVRKTKTA